MFVSGNYKSYSYDILKTSDSPYNSVFTNFFLYSEGKCWKATCSDPIVFRLLDKATQQNLIFGTNSKYKLDSLQLNKRPDFRIGQYDNLLSEVSCDSERLFTASGEYADTSYLRLTHTDIDTLVINYIRENNQCCVPYGGYGKIGLIKYNGKVAQKNGDIFKFEKE